MSQPQGWTQRPTEPRHAHLDCFSGIAGDMLLAACLDMGGPNLCEYVTRSLTEGLPALKGEFVIHHKRVWRGVGKIAGTHVTVQSVYGEQAVPVPWSSHDHAHGHSHGGSHSHDQQEHAHEHSHGHSHEHGHANGTAASHSHINHHDYTSSIGPLRNLPDIRQLLQQAPRSAIPEWVCRVALMAFELLAQAEAHVHGADSPDTVHFHEVGAIDSLVDTIGSLLAFNALGITTVSCSALPLGQGTVRAAHGLLPVPAPATLFLLRDLPVCAGPPGVTGELVTPTGAALVRALLQECGTAGARAPHFTLRNIGVGAGTKDFVQHPNTLRILVGDSTVHDDRKKD